MRDNLREANYLWRLLPHGDKPPCYSYEGGSSRLVRFRGLCMNGRGVLSHGGFTV
jgi:hypothetical protein